MPSLYTRSQNQYEIYAQKHVKLNNSASLPAIPQPIEIQSSASSLAFLLEKVARVAEAYAAELRREEINKNAAIRIQNALNFLQDFKPIAPALDLRMAQLYSPVDLSATSTGGFSVLAEQEAVSSRVNLSDSGSEPSQKSGKSVQSKFKNCYGLVVGRTIRSIKEYFRLIRQKKSNVVPENFRYGYIHDIIGKFSAQETESFENYIKKYHERKAEEKKNRGKSTVYRFLEQEIFNGLILVRIIQEFLQSENADFQSYVNNETKPKKQVSHVLSDEKNLAQLRDAFREMEFNLEKKGVNFVKHEEDL